MLKNFLKSDDHDHEETSEEGIAISPIESHWGPNLLTFFGPDSRAILITGEVTQEQANCVISQMLELTSESSTEPIYVYINTDGGDIVAGLAIYDMMRITPCPVITLVVGACHSAGLFILQGGDKRGATPHASFFYHEPVTMFHANTEHGTIAGSDNYINLRSSIDDILQKRSRISKTVWKKDFAGKTAFYFTTEKAIEYKLIDEVIEYSKTRPLKLKPLAEI